MKSEVLASWNLPWLSSIGLMLFFVVFMGMIFIITRKENKKIYEKIEKIPLHEGDLNE